MEGSMRAYTEAEKRIIFRYTIERFEYSSASHTGATDVTGLTHPCQRAHKAISAIAGGTSWEA
jgi:hypothetical protein